MDLQSIVLQNLIHNEDYTRQVIPHLEARYFEGEHKTLFNEIVKFVTKYGKLPNKEALVVELQQSDLGDNAAAVFSLTENVTTKPLFWS